MAGAPPDTTGSEPLTLQLDEDTGDRLLIYRGKEGVRVDLRVDGDTFWATQAQMATMFGVTQQAVSGHILNIFADGELADDDRTHKKFLSVRTEGARQVRRQIDHYDLNMLIAVGYRVGGPMGTMFRIWATERLFQYLTKGFVLDERRLKNPDGRPDHFDELLDRIRDIRSSEKRMWTRVLELASFCSDYDETDERQHAPFFAEIQTTKHWAVRQQTAAEIVVAEVSADKPNAGVMHFSGRQPTVDEAVVAKNLLAEGEISALNHITSLTLEFFESQAEQRRPTTLDAFLGKMRDLVKLDGRPLKPQGHSGLVSARAALEHASREIGDWKARERALREKEGERALAALAADARGRKGRRKPQATDKS